MEEVVTNMSSEEEIVTELQSITAAQLNSWMSRKVQPYLKGQIAEVGNKNNITGGLRRKNKIVAISTSCISENSNNSYDTIISIDMAASIFNPRISLEDYTQLLATDGTFIVLSRVNIALFSESDKALKYWHKFNKSYIKRSLHGYFDIVKIWYFTLIETPDYRFTQETSSFNKSVTKFYISDTESLQRNCLFVLAVADKRKSKKKSNN